MEFLPSKKILFIFFPPILSWNYMLHITEKRASISSIEGRLLLGCYEIDVDKGKKKFCD
jgi:hypothetical protein